MVKGIIFDLDGTLLNSMSIWDNVGPDYIKFLGYEPEEGLEEKFRALTMVEAATYVKETCRLEWSLEKIMDGINKMVEDHYFYDFTLKPKVELLLERLDKMGIKMCIATATDKYLVEAVLKRCKVDQYFSQIFTCTEIGHGKDNPAIFRQALSHLGTKKDETLLFEDSFHAIKTAKSDGFRVVAIKDTSEKKWEEIKALSDVSLRSFEEIADSEAFTEFWKLM